MKSVRAKVQILAVCPRADHRAVNAAFSQCNWELTTAASLAEASGAMRENETPVVLCSSELPDGTWRDLALAVGGWRHPPRIVVIAAEADQKLWAEVLEVGYDLLLTPFDPREIFPVLGFAWRSWTTHVEREPFRSMTAGQPAHYLNQ